MTPSELYAVPDQLIKNNPGLNIYRIDSPHFFQYGKIIENIEIENHLEPCSKVIPMPSEWTMYVPDYPQLKTLLQDFNLKQHFDEEPIQYGFCSGKNTTINGAEYHKSPEIFIAITDCLQFLTSFNHLHNYESLDSSAADLFYFPKGTVALIYSYVLHLAPLSATSSGFQSVIILPKGTNEEHSLNNDTLSTEAEAHLYFKYNKWILAHPERTQLVSQGVHIGLTGDNRSINTFD